MGGKRGFIQLPILAIIAIFAAISTAGYFGYEWLQDYQARQLEKEQQTQELILSQQEALKEAKQKIGGLETESASTRAQLRKIQEASLKKLSNKEIINKVKPAVVYIKTKDGAGSGMIIEGDGLILTNAHVVNDVNSAQIKLSDSRSFIGTVIGRNEDIDLALIKIDGNNLPVVELGNSDIAEQGDEVSALGYPFGLEGDVSFKEGTISRRIENYFEISAEIHPGNSGGPLVNRYGQVIGINTAIFGKSVSGIQVGETIKLVIPINTAKNIVADLKAGKNVFAKSQEDETVSNPPVMTSSLSKYKSLYNAYLVSKYEIFRNINNARESYNNYISYYNADKKSDAQSQLVEAEWIFSVAYRNSQSLKIPFDSIGSSLSTKIERFNRALVDYTKEMGRVVDLGKQALDAELDGYSSYGLTSSESSAYRRTKSLLSEVIRLDEEVIEEASRFFNW